MTHDDAAKLARTGTVPLLPPDAMGEPAEVAAQVLRQVIEACITLELDNEQIFGSEDKAGPLDEAVAALERQDYRGAGDWLLIALALALEPFGPVAKGSRAADRRFRAQMQRTGAVIATRAALHILAPLLTPFVLAERMASISQPRQ